jgi:tagatose 6-phosphate kinase
VIVVVSLNPALDITHEVAGADWAGVNRADAVHARPGGKGLNVARTLDALGQSVLLTGLAGGLTGQVLADSLAGTGIRVELTPIAGETRRTFTVSDTVHGRTALFNEPGPAVTEGEYERFLAGYQQALASGAAVVLSGSLPLEVPDDAYAGLIAAASSAGVPTILDTSGAALRRGAAAGPSVVKPNLAELEAAAGRRLGTAEQADLTAVEHAARELADQGSRAADEHAGPRPSAWRPATVVVSLGPLGLLAVGQDGTWLARPPELVSGNATGAGDAVVAGLADGLVRGMDWPDRLRHATALGGATARAPVAGEFAMADYERLRPAVLVTAAAPAAGSAAGQAAWTECGPCR